MLFGYLGTAKNNLEVVLYHILSRHIHICLLNLTCRPIKMKETVSSCTHYKPRCKIEA